MFHTGNISSDVDSKLNSTDEMIDLTVVVQDDNSINEMTKEITV